MMKVNVYNQKGEKAGTAELPDSVFGLKWNADLVHQVVTGQAANLRRGTAHAKGRSEVRGGGRKPWRQKGTGRARHGSIRSPLWVGGGVTHGPLKERRYDQKINKKMARAAVYSVLSKKLLDNELRVVDSFAFSSHKTKELFTVLTNVLKSSRPSALLVPGEQAVLAARASRNIPRVRSLSAMNLNVIDLLKYKNVVMEKKAVE